MSLNLHLGVLDFLVLTLIKLDKEPQMKQIMNPLNQVFANHSKKMGLGQPSFIVRNFFGVRQAITHLIEAWLEARSEQAKFYNQYPHIE